MLYYIQPLCYKLQNDQEFDIFGYPNEYANNLIYIIESDMRNMIHQPIMQQLLSKQNNKQEGIADIIVSELLGSFGDNELSPECLDGISNDIMKKDCVSIPQEYTSYIAPCSSVKLYNEARMQSFTPMSTIDLGGGGIFGIQRALETPYVVRAHACSVTHAEQSCFTFHHPTKQLESNERFMCLEFPYDSSFGIAVSTLYPLLLRSFFFHFMFILFLEWMWLWTI